MVSSLGVLLFVVASQHASALPIAAAKASWPAPVTAFIERSESCMHFAGEFSGDGSAHDVEISHKLAQLRCNALTPDLQALRRLYRSDARISTRLTAFDEDGLPKSTKPHT